MSWRDHAACRTVDPALFFPDRGEQPHKAKRICDGCPVTAACLTYALETNQSEGIWGGLSRRERAGYFEVHQSPICSIEDCERSHRAKGLCTYHYTKRLRYGSPLEWRKAGRKRVAPPDEVLIETIAEPTQAVADAFGVSPSTIRHHRARLRKQGVVGKSSPASARRTP